MPGTAYRAWGEPASDMWGSIVGRATNAARIEDRWAVGQLDEVLLVAVAAQNYACLHVTQSLPHRGQTCSHELASRRFLDEIPIVIGRVPWQARMP